MPRTLFPILQYRDPRAAVDLLERAFGFEPLRVVDETPDGEIAHAELRVRRRHRCMLSGARPDGPFGDHAGQGWCYVVVADADAHHDRAVAAGRRGRRTPLTDQDYGSRDYSARDPEGNLWSFGTYAAGVTRGSYRGGR